MTEQTPETPDVTPAPAPTGVKAKANDLVMKAYLAAPPKAQTTMLNGFLKAQPAIAKVKPHGKQIVAGVAGLLVLRKVRRRKG